MPLAEIPVHVQQAFIAAEDKRFYQHRGIDERALIRAFIGNLAQSGRPQGGSTITQQVVKNLLVGDDVTYERKMREMILAARVEQTLTKDEILELYLNSTYLGRGSWGVEMAARSYFGKPVQDAERRRGRLAGGAHQGAELFQSGPLSGARQGALRLRARPDAGGRRDQQPRRRKQLGGLPRLAAFERPRRDTGFHFVDHLAREARSVAGLEGLTADSYTIRSTINPALQRAAETALQEGLARYEINVRPRPVPGAPRPTWPTRSRRIEAEHEAAAGKPAWQQALESARLPLYDVHWPAAVVIEKAAVERRRRNRCGSAWRMAASCRCRPAAPRACAVSSCTTSFWSGDRGQGQEPPRAELRVRPTVQGAAVVLENKTGRILAMVGGFSYPLSQLNRATQSQRQPGSALKPLTYLAALQKGLQPNTLVRDESITLPPIGGTVNARRGLLDAEELRRRLLRHHHAAPRARELQEPRDRQPARRRHRCHARR